MAMAEGLTAGKSWEWGNFVLVETLDGDDLTMAFEEERRGCLLSPIGARGRGMLFHRN